MDALVASLSLDIASENNIPPLVTKNCARVSVKSFLGQVGQPGSDT